MQKSSFFTGNTSCYKGHDAPATLVCAWNKLLLAVSALLQRHKGQIKLSVISVMAISNKCSESVPVNDETSMSQTISTNFHCSCCWGGGEGSIAVLFVAFRFVWFGGSVGWLIGWGFFFFMKGGYFHFTIVFKATFLRK